MNEMLTLMCFGFTLLSAILMGLNLKLYTEFAKERFKSKGTKE